MTLTNQLTYKTLYASLCLLGVVNARVALAQTEQSVPTVQLPDIYVQVDKNIQGAPLAGKLGVSEHTLGSYQLKQRGTNLGDALANELGVHANQFGGGASAPVIRGQEGKRIKILSGGSEVLDMSAMSPDHAVAVDSVLAKRIEILRGANTLLYASGNSAGVVNVVDDKIPSKLPNATEAEVGVRLNSADKERLVNVAVSHALGEHIAVHAEGLYKKSDDYRTPAYEHQGKRHRKLDNSFADSKSGSVGTSWITDKGYIGLAYSQRKDKYGLPAHSHLYDDYYMHVLLSDAHWKKPYLQHYPFLMEETDIDYNNPGIDCIKKEWHSHGHLCNHGHAHAHQGEDNHSHAHHDNPHIALNTKRWDLRSEWQEPVKGVSRVRFFAGKVDYHHEEKSGAISDNSFKNQGNTLRLELLHTPVGRTQGVIGVGRTYQKTHALDNHTLDYRRQHLLHDHDSAQNSLFVVERVDLGKLKLDIGGRIERQKIAMQYNLDVPNDERPPQELTKPHQSTAYSYVITADYQANDKHRFGATISHQQRSPNAQELYAHGKHLATNAFEAGNKNLSKERSNNIELGWTYQGDKTDVRLNGYYNHFDNYIYAAILNDKTCDWRPNKRCTRSLNDAYPLRLYRYNQAKARIYGLEAEVGYQLNPDYRVAVFGDFVRGKLKDLPALPTGYRLAYDEHDNQIGVVPIDWEKQPDGHAPRMPAPRLGLKLNANFDNGMGGYLQLYRVFDQNKVARLESPTKGHTMLNAGMSYDGVMGTQAYTLFANASNLLNQKVYNHASFLSYLPQSGRSVNVGLMMKF